MADRGGVMEALAIILSIFMLAMLVGFEVKGG